MSKVKVERSQNLNTSWVHQLGLSADRKPVVRTNVGPAADQHFEVCTRCLLAALRRLWLLASYPEWLKWTCRHCVRSETAPRMKQKERRDKISLIYAPVTLTLTRWASCKFWRLTCMPKNELSRKSKDEALQKDRNNRTHYQAAFTGGNKRKN